MNNAVWAVTKLADYEGIQGVPELFTTREEAVKRLHWWKDKVKNSRWIDEEKTLLKVSGGHIEILEVPVYESMDQIIICEEGDSGDQ